jgi:hypothetical protein
VGARLETQGSGPPDLFVKKSGGRQIFLVSIRKVRRGSVAVFVRVGTFEPPKFSPSDLPIFL